MRFVVICEDAGRAFPSPCGEGLGKGVTPNLSRGILDAWPQLDQPRPDRLQHSVKIAKHIVLREPKNGESLRRKRGRARGVARELFVGRMRRAVDFEDEPGVERGEVGDLAAKDHLASKPEACELLAPEALPEAALVALRLRERATGVNLFGMARPPSLTLPHKGEGNAPAPPIRARLRPWTPRDNEVKTYVLRVRATRNPRPMSRPPVVLLLRPTERRLTGALIQEPPRTTRRLQSPLLHAEPLAGAAW